MRSQFFSRGHLTSSHPFVQWNRATDSCFVAVIETVQHLEEMQRGLDVLQFSQKRGGIDSRGLIRFFHDPSVSTPVERDREPEIKQAG